MEICHFSLTNTDTVLLSFDLMQALMMIHDVHSLLWCHYHQRFSIYVVDMLNLQMKRNMASMEKQQNTVCSTYEWSLS